MAAALRDNLIAALNQLLEDWRHYDNTEAPQETPNKPATEPAPRDDLGTPAGTVRPRSTGGSKPAKRKP